VSGEEGHLGGSREAGLLHMSMCGETKASHKEEAASCPHVSDRKPTIGQMAKRVVAVIEVGWVGTGRRLSYYTTNIRMEVIEGIQCVGANWPKYPGTSLN